MYIMSVLPMTVHNLRKTVPFLNIFKRCILETIFLQKITFKKSQNKINHWGKNMMNFIFKVVLGLTLIILGLMLLTHPSWLSATVGLIKAGVVILIILIGLATTFRGLAEIKDKI